MNDQRPGFTFLVCPDGRLLRAALERQLAAHPPASGAWERHVFWGDEEPAPQFWEQLALQGLFGAARAVVVRQAQLWPATVWKKVSHALARPAAQCWPFFCLEGAWERGQPRIPAHIARLRCMAFADRQGWIWRQDGLNERGVKKYVLQRARELGLTFEQDALEQFCAAVPPEGQAIEGELDKLRLLCGREGGGAVTADMTGSAPWSPEFNVFGCIRHMEAGNLPAVWRELARGEESDSLLFSLLALLARELRLLWKLQAGEPVRLHPGEAGFKRQLARGLGPERLAEAMAALVDAEAQVKSGRRDPGQSLEALAVRMTALFSPPPGRRA